MLYWEGVGLIIGRRASIKSNWRFAVALGGWPFVSSLRTYDPLFSFIVIGMHGN